MKKTLLIIKVLLSFYGFSQTLDPTFNGNGIVTNQFSVTADLNSVYDAILQPDGKMIYVGGIGLAGIGYFSNSYVARVNTDGTLDTTFNGRGFYISKKTTTDNSQLFYNVKMQANGKIVVAARNKVYQFNTDGSLDTSFENGLYLTPSIMNMTIQADGKIVLTGFKYNGVKNVFSVIRLNIDGSFDATFGNSGIQTIDFINNADNFSYGLALQSDNKILVAGSVYNTTTDFAIARLTASGVLDTTFGNGGTLITSLTGSQNATSIAIQPDGKILLGGSSNGMFTVIRYNTDGLLDTTFNNTGEIITTLPTPTSFNADNTLKQIVKYLPSDKIVLSGTSNSNFALMQFNSDGSIDTNFGTNGTTIYNAGNNENSEALLLNPDGKIIIAGSTFYTGGTYYVGATSKIQQLQFSSTGTLESSYQSNLINGTDKIISIIEQTDGKTIALASTKNASQYDNVNLIKYNTDSSIDATFGVNGTILVSSVVSFSSDSFKLKQQIDGKLLVSGGNPSLYRFNSDGSVDNSFGTNGFVDLSTNSNYQINFVDNIFPQPDGKIFVTGELLLNVSSSNTSLGLIRLNSDGTIDTTFGINGYATTRFDYFGVDSDEFAKEIYIQSDGKIVVSSSLNTPYGFSPVNNIIGITRFDTNGLLDTTFGTNGHVINSDSKSFETELLGCSDDKFIINYNSSNIIGATAKYNADGSIDNSFGINGLVTDSIFYNDMILQSDGKIVKGGTFNNQFYITRFNNNGSIDTPFGTNGSLNTPINSNASITKMVLLQNGKILAGGYAFNGTNQVFAQARYTFDNLGMNGSVINNSFKIYPNPANSQFTIDLGNEIKSINYQVKILNLLGQEVYHSFEKTIVTTIPVTWTGKGLYFVNIYDEQNNLLKTDKLLIK